MFVYKSVSFRGIRLVYLYIIPLVITKNRKISIGNSCFFVFVTLFINSDSLVALYFLKNIFL